MKAVEQYLNRYAEPVIQAFRAHLQDSSAFFPNKDGMRCSYAHTVVIPAYAENKSFIQRIIQDFTSQPILVIGIVNQPDYNLTAHNPSIKKSAVNKALLHWLNHSFEALSNFENLSLHVLSSKVTLLLIDRDRTPIPAKHGVGLARKLGADCAALLIHLNIVQSPWIASTDADTHLPLNYFRSMTAAQTNAGNTSALCFAFLHAPAKPSVQAVRAKLSRASRIEQETTTLTQWYEAKLHHYVLGLKYAQSPFAFHTIGSCMAAHYQAYCQVRGFPKRPAGEDFYLLNKLAKVGTVHTVAETIITIDTRLSQRVPFGTGPAVVKIMEDLHSKQDSPFTASTLALSLAQTPMFYNPDIFRVLKSTNQIALEFLTEKTSEISVTSPSFNTIHSPTVGKLLIHFDLIPQLKIIRQQFKKLEQRTLAYHSFFDGFKIMKAVHFLRDNGYGNVDFSVIRQADYLEMNYRFDTRGSPNMKKAHPDINESHTEPCMQKHIEELRKQLWRGDSTD